MVELYFSQVSIVLDFLGGKRKFLIIIGKQYWIHDGAQISKESPQPITKYGIGPHIEKIDAVMIWGEPFF